MTAVGSSLAAATLAWSASVAKRGADPHRGTIGARERLVFRSVNRGEARLAPGTWLLMQAGSFAGVLVASLLVRRRSTSEARRVATVGTVAWLGAKAIKPLVGRGRPTSLLDDVVVRGQPQVGLGFPSGHAAVALALAMTAVPRGSLRPVAVALAGSVGVTRVRVGAHLPLDVVGGLAIGILSSGLRRLLR